MHVGDVPLRDLECLDLLRNPRLRAVGELFRGDRGENVHTFRELGYRMIGLSYGCSSKILSVKSKSKVRMRHTS